MKALKILLLTLALALTLASCDTLGLSGLPDADGDMLAPPFADGDYTVEDISFTEGMDYAEALEPFWEDDEYQYVFPAIMSHDCTVTYSNGATENVVDALEAGRVTVEDLERFDIGFFREPLPTGIKEIRPVDGEGDTVAHALRIVEGDYSYMVGAEQYVVEYASGESESLDEAVRDGRVTVADLDRLGIPYTREQSVTPDDKFVVVGGGDGKEFAEYEYNKDENGEGKFVVSGEGSYVITDIDPDKLTELFPNHEFEYSYKEK